MPDSVGYNVQVRTPRFFRVDATPNRGHPIVTSVYTISDDLMKVALDLVLSIPV